MKKILLFLVLTGLSQIAFPQVGINTTSPSAQLDIKSSNQAVPANTDGILIPKIDAFPLTNPTAAQNSMMVYLTTTSAGKPPGFYYWDNATTSWIGIAGSKGWEVTGNSGTNPAVNFMGTTDDNDVVFKRQNLVSGKIQANNTSFGLNTLLANTTGNKNVAIGNNALTSNQNATDNTAIGNDALKTVTYGCFNTAVGSNALLNNVGYSNTAVGVSALRNNQSGSGNVAIGRLALNDNINGGSNTAIGTQSLWKNQSGSQNFALGGNSLLNNIDGANNSVMGFAALYENVSGNNNTALGASALTKSLGSDNIGIGMQAANNLVTGSNNLAIGNNAMTNLTAGSGNIVLGNNATAPSATGSNQLNIGSVLYGTDVGSTTLGKIGVGLTAPSAKFQINASNQAAPANTDGILIPKIDAFPATNPTAAQNSMMVYLTTTSAGKLPGFYYWDNATTSWKSFGSGIISNGTAVGNTMYWNGTSWVNNSSFLFNDGTKVGINTATPSSMFTVKQDGIGMTQESSSAAAQVGFYTAGSNAYVQTHSNSDLSFATNNASAQMVLQKTTGNLGIGNTVPTSKLEVQATAGTAVISGRYTAPANASNISVFNANLAPTAAMGTGSITGAKNDLAGINAVTVNGVQNTISGNGTGSQFGFKNQFTSTGSSSLRYGLFNSFNSVGAESYGLYNDMLGTGISYGTYNHLTNSTTYSFGSYTKFDGPGNGDRYGNYIEFWDSAAGDWYGNYVYYEYLSSSGASGKKFGYYVGIPPAVGGSEQYGVYSYVGDLTRGYAGYFDGRVSIGSVVDSNHYTLPYNRGTNGQVMQTDGSGNVTWQSISIASDADFFEVGGTLPPDAITDNMYHTGNVSIGINTNDNHYKLQASTAQLTANGDGQATIYAYRDRDSQNDGSSYANTTTNSAIKGYNYQGDVYTFGVSGFCYNDFNRTGGVFGSYHNGGYWGSLGYKSSANTAYGVYASAAGFSTPGTGRMMASRQEYTIGGGFYGGLIGSWSRGTYIGNINSGELFASYNSGDEYTLGKQIELVDTGNSKTAAYTVTSTEVVVYKKGKIALQNGTAHVAFDADYARLLGDAPIVTTTPMGQCNGIYIESVDKNGFTIRELNHGTSNVMISWIAVGDRIDSDKTAAATVSDKDFDANINEVLFNENNLNGKGKAMWSDGRSIQFGELPEQFKDKTPKK